MIIGSFNTRGGGNKLKKKRISQIIGKDKAYIFLIQESKLEVVDLSIVRNLWANEKVGWSYSGSMDAAGGLITLWREDVCEFLASFKGDNFLVIKISIQGKFVYIIYVHSSCFIHLKRKLWHDLLDFKAKHTDGEWCVGGYFNAIGSKFNCRRTETRELACFILDFSLIDVQCKGKAFSWYNGDENSMSRIDRFLVSNSLISEWGIIGQFIDDRNISDHYPVWLSIDNKNWGPKPFRVKDSWFDNAVFLPYVEKEWKNLQVGGRSDFILKEKMRLLKSSLCIWDKEFHNRVAFDIEEDIGAINAADSLLESCKGSMIKEVVEKRSEAICEIRKKMDLKDNLIMQKINFDWIHNGDLNTKYFHNCLKDRNRRNQLGPILVDEVLMEDVREIKEEVRRYYNHLYAESDCNRPTFPGVQFKVLSSADRDMLEEPFTEFEISKAVWDCGGAKSPGPDDFNFNFIKKCWSFLKEDFVRMIMDFHNFGKFSKSISSSFLTLIPKKASPL